MHLLLKKIIVLEQKLKSMEIQMKAVSKYRSYLTSIIDKIPAGTGTKVKPGSFST